MNDFFNNYRNGKDKRFERTRRPYGINQFNGSERRMANDKKRVIPFKTSVPPGLWNLIEEMIPGIKNLLETINESQKRFTTAQEKVAEAEKRKADALESIADYLKQMIGPVVSSATDELSPEFTCVSEAVSPKKINAPAATAVDRQEVVEMIRDLRAKEMSYEKIARRLESQGLPTFSGKGKWRGQTVHRLLNDLTITEGGGDADQPA